MEINEVQDPDYEVVTISNLGFVDPYGNEGLVILHSDDKREFHMLSLIHISEPTRPY